MAKAKKGDAKGAEVPVVNVDVVSDTKKVTKS